MLSEQCKALLMAKRVNVENNVLVHSIYIAITWSCTFPKYCSLGDTKFPWRHKCAQQHFMANPVEYHETTLTMFKTEAHPVKSMNVLC